MTKKDQVGGWQPTTGAVGATWRSAGVGSLTSPPSDCAQSPRRAGLGCSGPAHSSGPPLPGPAPPAPHWTPAAGHPVAQT